MGNESLLPLGEVRKHLRVVGEHYVGLREIPTEAIVGSVDRAVDFDRFFRTRRRELKRRIEALRTAIADRPMPPISMYGAGGLYFVSDGHHRVALALGPPARRCWPRPPPPRPDQARAARELASDEKLRHATGRTWEEWLDILHGSGAWDLKHGAIAELLSAHHGVPGWWTQAITTGYERARGMRLKHQQPDGFTIYASKTVGAPLTVLFAASTSERIRKRWLTDGSMSLRSSQPGRVAPFEWDDGPTRVIVTFEEKGPSKSTAYVSHERLSNSDTTEEAKGLWKKRVASLKSFLESTDE